MIALGESEEEQKIKLAFNLSYWTMKGFSIWRMISSWQDPAFHGDIMEAFSWPAFVNLWYSLGCDLSPEVKLPYNTTISSDLKTKIATRKLQKEYYF